MRDLKTEIKTILSYLDSLKELIKDCDYLDEEGIDLLVELFKRKIHHYLIFDCLLRCNKKRIAYALIEDFYLGNDITLSNNIKDHVADLELFFDSIVEYGGESELKSFFDSHRIFSNNLSNERVVKAVQFALDIEEEKLPLWFDKIKTK